MPFIIYCFCPERIQLLPSSFIIENLKDFENVIFFLWTCLSRGQINCVTKTNSQEHFSSHKILKKANMLLCLTCVHHMMWMCTKVLFYNNEIFIEKLYTKSCARFIWLSTFYFYFNLFCNGPTFKTSSGYNIFVNTNCIWYKNFIKYFKIDFRHIW